MKMHGGIKRILSRGARGYTDTAACSRHSNISKTIALMGISDMWKTRKSPRGNGQQTDTQLEVHVSILWTKTIFIPQKVTF